MANTSVKNLSRETHAIMLGIMTMSVATIVAWAYFLMRNTTMITYTDIGSIAGIIGFLSSFVIFVRGFSRSLSAQCIQVRFGLWKYLKPTLSYVFALGNSLPFIIASITIGVAADNAFSQKIDGSFISSLMIGIVVATQTYSSSCRSYALSSEKIAVSISALLVVGSVSATLLSDSTDWWYKHFSAIGATANLSSFIFNSSVVISGVMLIGLAAMLTYDIRRLRAAPHTSSNMRPNWIRIMLLMLSLSGVMAIITGAIPYTNNFVVHDTAAKAIVIFLGLMIAVAPWALTVFSKQFTYASYGLLFVMGWLWPPVATGALKLSLYEILSGALCLLWLSIFTRYISFIPTGQDHTIHHD